VLMSKKSMEKLEANGALLPALDAPNTLGSPGSGVSLANISSCLILICCCCVGVICDVIIPSDGVEWCVIFPSVALLMWLLCWHLHDCSGIFVYCVCASNRDKSCEIALDVGSVSC